MYEENYEKNKEKIAKQRKEHHKNFPWKRTLVNIQQRCENPSNEVYKYYGGRGIECRITEEELEILWFRDKAWLLDQPSIDREDNDGHYIFENCQYIEKIENTVKDKRKIVLQFDLQGNFIKEWESAYQIERELRLCQAHLNRCCQGKKKQ